MQHRPWNKCGNAGRIAKWILGNIEDPLDYWQHGNGVTSAESNIRLALGDTVVTLENKWWGVRGSRIHLSSYVPSNPLIHLWDKRGLWAPLWLREELPLFWATRVLHDNLKDRDSFCWNEERASKRLRAERAHKVD